MPEARADLKKTPYVVGVTGGSASGKTTIANMIARQAARVSSVVLSEDDYYVDHSSDPAFDPRVFNYDDISAHDHRMLVEHLRTLKSGMGVHSPVYRFETHSRSTETVEKRASDLVIVEGIHCLYTEELRALLDYKIFVDVPDDIRLLRRLKRDVVERGRSIDDIARQYITTVRPMHYLYTYPTIAYADLVIRPKVTVEGERNDDDSIVRQLQPLLGIISMEVANGS